MKTINIVTRDEWRAWLAANHNLESEIWLVYYKKVTGKPSLEYGASVEEALCFGWVDSIIKKLDDERYARKFTPRKDESQWSPSNIKRVERMISQGKMTVFGMRKVEHAKHSGSWANPTQKPDLDFEMPQEFAQALKENYRAQETFAGLAPTYQKQYIIWIATARRPETKDKRIAEAIDLLAKGQKLGLR